LLKRLLDTFIVLLGVTTLVFFLLALVPGDPVDVMLGENAVAADREVLRETLGLNKPILSRWWTYLSQVAVGDLGQSIVRPQSVTELIAQRLPTTLQLAISAFAIILVLSIPLGMIAAEYKGKPADHFCSVLALLGISIPNFWLGPLLVLLFSISLGWLPVSGIESPASIILPALTLGLSLAAVTMRMLRSSLLEIFHQDYLRTARAKGLSPNQIRWRHAFPNALLPVVTLLGLQLGALLAGTVITEVVFALPGIGSLLIDAIRQRDYPVVQGVVLFIALSYVLINLMTDLVLQRIDPRIEVDA